MAWFSWIKDSEKGFPVKGPIGSVALAVFGAQVSPHVRENFTGATMYLDTSHLPMGNRELAFFIAAFAMLAKLAKADGDISGTEKKVVGRFIQNGLKLTDERRELALTIFHVARNVEFTFEDFARQFRDINKNRPEMLESFLDVLLCLAAADQVFSAEERKLLAVARDIFGIPEERFNQLKQRHQENINSHYHVLGCSPDDSPASVKKQYLKLSRKFHPDHVSKSGMPEEFSSVAQERYEKIEEAYAAIQKRNGGG